MHLRPIGWFATGYDRTMKERLYSEWFDIRFKISLRTSTYAWREHSSSMGQVRAMRGTLCIKGYCRLVRCAYALLFLRAWPSGYWLCASGFVHQATESPARFPGRARPTKPIKIHPFRVGKLVVISKQWVNATEDWEKLKRVDLRWLACVGKSVPCGLHGRPLS